VCSSRGSRTQARAMQWPWAWFLGGSVADWEWCRCLGALTWGSPVYPRCRSGTPGTCLGGVYRSTAGGFLSHCVQKRLAQWHGSVCSAWKGWKPSCLCGWLCGVGVFARGPLLSDSPLCRLLRCRVLSFLCCLFPPFQALQRVLCSLTWLGSVAT